MVHPRPILTSVLTAALISSCGQVESVRDITKQRLASGKQIHLGADSSTRFGLARREKKLLAWQGPQTWVAVPPTQFRLANFRLPGAVQCYLSILPGAAGGVLLNLNRWRGQMKAEAIGDQEVEQLERIPMLGSDAILMEVVEGDSDTPSKLLGVVLVAEDSVVFVKMIGPQPAVDAEKENFKRFIASLRRNGEKPKLRWDTPADWQTGAVSKMRVVTFLPPGEHDLECYVTMLRGDGGSALLNVNRWRDQLGMVQTDEASVAALPHLHMLGTRATLVELHQRQGDGEGTSMLGVICRIQGHCVFIKMVGPANAVRAARDGFLQLARSLRS